MKKYIFITENNSEGEIVYNAISEDRIETINLSDVYTEYGQTVGAYEAGDSLDILTEEVVDFVAKWAEENNEELSVKIGENINAYNNILLYDAITEEFGSEDNENITFNRLTVKGFHYWDGHNHQTITVSTDVNEPSHSIEEDEELVEKLNKAIENKSFKSKGSGVTYYEYEDENDDYYEITDSAWQGTWEAYSIVINPTYEQAN